MEYFNLEEIDLLKEYERYFYTVIYLKYKSGTKHPFNVRLQEIYEKHTGVQEKINWSCPSCAYAYYKKVGELYYDSIEQNKKEVGIEPEPALNISKLDNSVTNNETKPKENAKAKIKHTKSIRKGNTKPNK